MAKEVWGDACACIQEEGKDKSYYYKIGNVIYDNTYDTFSIKIDTLPIPGSGWTGWINLFKKTERSQENYKPAKATTGKPVPDFPDDDIPF